MDFFKRYSEWGYPQEAIELPTVIRINPLRCDETKIVERLRKRGIELEKIPYLLHGYTFKAEFAASSTPEYLLGYYYIQEAASQIPIQVLSPRKGDIVIDMAAAPGSKTTQAAALMQNTGTLLALDASHARLEALRNNIERMGVSCAIVLHKEAQYVDDLPFKADKILLDAPCSGNFTIEENWEKKRSAADFQASATLQKQLLEAAWQTLKGGGRLVYSTCSLEKEEDEDVIEWALAHLAGATLVSIDLKTGSPGLTEKTKGCIRMWPAQHGTQGFFVSLLQKAP
jgi:NOL1/NOP2/sun family putative RNA methylase